MATAAPTIVLALVATRVAEGGVVIEVDLNLELAAPPIMVLSSLEPTTVVPNLATMGLDSIIGQRPQAYAATTPS